MKGRVRIVNSLSKRKSEFVSVVIFFLILLIPTQLRYHFWPDYSIIQGIKVDYLSVHISLFDVVWLAMILPVIPDLIRNLPDIIGNLYKKSPGSRVKHGMTLIIITLNLLFSQLPLNSLYKYFQLFQAVSLYWLLTQLPNQKKVLGVVKKAFLVGLCLMSLLAVWQFIKNGSVGGLWYFFGERTFSVTTPGISTFVLWGREHIRPYAFFSHPNSLAGYLGVSLLVVPMPVVLWVVVLVVILMTNSWNALIAVVIVLILKRSLPWRMARRGLMKLVVWGFVLFNLVFYLLSWISAPDVLISAQRGLAGRLFLTKEVLTQIVSLLPFGLGAGNEILATAQSNFFWTPQPVHNLLLILFADFGFLIFVICYLVHRWMDLLSKQKGGFELLLFVLLTGIFDHYWWTLPQNLLLIPVLLYIINASSPVSSPRRRGSRLDSRLDRE